MWNLLKVKKKDTRTTSWRCSITVNLKHIWYFVLLFLLLTLSKWMPAARSAKQVVRNTNWYDSIIIYQWLHYYFPTNNYLFKVINKNTRTWCKICPKLTIKTSERRQWRRSGVFIVNFEHIWHHVFVYLLLTWST